MEPTENSTTQLWAISLKAMGYFLSSQINPFIAVIGIRIEDSENVVILILIPIKFPIHMISIPFSKFLFP